MKKVFERCLSAFSFMLLSVVMGALLAGCGNNKTAGSGIAVLNIEQAMDNVEQVKMSKYFSKIEYVPLETKPDVLVTDVSMTDMFPADDRIYVMNKERLGPTTTLSFDYSGKSLPFKAVEGRAEGEYVQGNSLRPYNDGVYMLDVQQVIKYDKEGNYLKSLPLDNVFYMINSFELLGDDIIYVYDNSQIKEDILYVMDGDFNRKFEKSLGKYELETKMRNIGPGGESVPVVSRSSQRANFVKSKDKIFIMGYGDTISSIKSVDCELVSEYVADLGRYAKGLKPSDVRSVFMETPAFTLYRVVFSVQGFPNIDREDRIVNCLYDRATGKSVRLKKEEAYTLEGNSASGTGFVNDLDGGMLFSPKEVYGNKMYQLVNAYKFIEYAEATGSEAMLKVAEKLDEESNPVLVIATLK
ncbi:MAG: 6-bladed beta-propeller [Bacteroidales bacterium]|nr:6-bladed beta-propeller [Bacteroidales bacterium]